MEWLSALCSLIAADGRIADYWKCSVLLLVFKWKQDPMECGSHRAVMLLERAMKLTECVFIKELGRKLKMYDKQFGFRLGWELPMDCLPSGRCGRNMGLKERLSY